MPSDETLKEFYAAEIERLTDSLDNLQDEINAIFAMADGQPGESAAQAVKRQLGRYSQRSRDEDTARIRMNHARIKAEDTVRSLREMLDSQGRISEQHRARVRELSDKLAAVQACSRCYPVCQHWTEPIKAAAEEDA